MRPSDRRQQAEDIHERLPDAIDASPADVEKRLDELVDDYQVPLDEARRGVVSYYLEDADENRDRRSNLDDQVEVLVLGSIHVAKFGDEILAPDRQREFEELVDRLTTWEPDGVAVELPEEHQAGVNAVYEEYRSGERAYDEVSEMGPFNPYVDDPTGECHSEPVQIGFRLADRLDHDRVYAVDYPMTLDEYLTDEEDDAADWEAIQEVPSEFGTRVPNDDLDQRWHDSTVVEFLRWLNHEENVRSNERSHLAMALVGVDQQYVGAKMQAGWYDRNLRIIENLWRAAERDGLDRILLVIGYGHVHIMRRLLSDAPTLYPADPRLVLSEQ